MAWSRQWIGAGTCLKAQDGVLAASIHPWAVMVVALSAVMPDILVYVCSARPSFVGNAQKASA